jgi:hypothetical protein
VHIGCKVYFGDFLLDRQFLGTLQQICGELAPTWSWGLHLQGSPLGRPDVCTDDSADACSLSGRFCSGWLLAGTAPVGGLTFHVVVAPAVSGDSEFERLQFLLDAEASG